MDTELRKLIAEAKRGKAISFKTRRRPGRKFKPRRKRVSSNRKALLNAEAKWKMSLITDEDEFGDNELGHHNQIKTPRLNEDMTVSTPITIPVRGAVDFIVQTEILKFHENNRVVYFANRNYTVPAGFKLENWAASEIEAGGRVIAMSPYAIYLFFDWGYVFSDVSGNLLDIAAYGSKEKINSWIDSQKEKYGFLDKIKYLNWVIGESYSKMEVKRVPLDTTPLIQSAYPWLDCSVKEYAKKYFDNKASILVLIGPPGTGKTSFLKGLISELDGEACVTYDSHLLNEDGIFADFIENEEAKMMVFEDADNFIEPREDGNSMMHRFLNVSAGLVSPMRGKKIVFTTNLPSAERIDPALIRPGRCYEILHFRNLGWEESKAIAEEVYGENCPDIPKREYSLAEITNFDRIDLTKVKRKVGFV